MSTSSSTMPHRGRYCQLKRNPHARGCGIVVLTSKIDGGLRFINGGELHTNSSDFPIGAFTHDDVEMEAGIWLPALKHALNY